MNVAVVEKRGLEKLSEKWMIPLGVGLLMVMGLVVYLGFKSDPTYPVGSLVIAQCKQTYMLGKVKRVRASGYEIKFGPETQPILCTPYLWKSRYLEPYEPVTEIRHGGVLYKVGDRVAMEVKVDKRRLHLLAEISDITANGRLKLRPIDGEPLAIGFFQQNVGRNYIDFSRYPLRKRG